MTTLRPRKPALFRHLLLAALASLPLACKDGGCGGGSSADPAGPSAAGSASGVASSSSVPFAGSASAVPPRWNAVRATGAAGALFRAVNTIELNEEQRATLEKIAADIREAERAARDVDAGAPRSDMKEAYAALVAGVKAGKIEPAKMAPHYAALEKTAKARQDREADALNRLHAALDPSQRAAVVGAARAVEEKRVVRMNVQDRPDAGGPDPAKLRLQRYTRELGLDAEQQKKLANIVPPENRAANAREELAKQTEVLLAAFEKEAFDAKNLDLGATKAARAPIEDQVKLFGQLLPILKPEQRERLAKNLERTSGLARPHRGMSSSERVHDLGHDDGHGEDDGH